MSCHHPLLLEREKKGNVHLELDVLRAIDPVGEEDRGEVDVGVVPAVECAESVLRKALDPFSACGAVENGVVAVGGGAHGWLICSRQQSCASHDHG